MTWKDQINSVLWKWSEGQVCLNCLVKHLPGLTQAQIIQTVQDMRTDRRSYVSEYEAECSACGRRARCWACG
jgi:hypothetical protein